MAGHTSPKLPCRNNSRSQQVVAFGEDKCLICQSYSFTAIKMSSGSSGYFDKQYKLVCRESLFSKIQPGALSVK